MNQPRPEPGEPERLDELCDLPVDPDIDAPERPAAPDSRRGGPQARRRGRSRWPRIHWPNVAAVAAGGFCGGIARYAVLQAWPTGHGAFPWALFGVNTGGAFLLGLLLVLVAEVLPSTAYARPTLGTGFCGAFTTFSSVATNIDQLAAHGHALTAAGYLAGDVFAGLGAAAFGMIVGRSIAVTGQRRKGGPDAG